MFVYFKILSFYAKYNAATTLFIDVDVSGLNFALNRVNASTDKLMLSLASILLLDMKDKLFIRFIKFFMKDFRNYNNKRSFILLFCSKNYFFQNKKE